MPGSTTRCCPVEQQCNEACVCNPDVDGCCEACTCGDACACGTRAPCDCGDACACGDDCDCDCQPPAVKMPAEQATKACCCAGGDDEEPCEDCTCLIECECPGRAIRKLKDELEEQRKQVDMAREELLTARSERNKFETAAKTTRAELSKLQGKVQVIVPPINVLFGACEVAQDSGGAFKLQQASEVFTAMQSIRSTLMDSKDQ